MCCWPVTLPSRRHYLQRGHCLPTQALAHSLAGAQESATEHLLLSQVGGASEVQLLGCSPHWGSAVEAQVLLSVQALDWVEFVGHQSQPLALRRLFLVLDEHRIQGPAQARYLRRG